MGSRLSGIATGTLLLSLSAVPLVGQVVGVDVSIASRGIWRGLIRTSRPVVEGDAFASLPLSGSVRLTAGGWASLEPFSPSSTALTNCEHLSGCLGEKRLWAELALNTPTASLHAGWIGYFDRRFPAPNGTSLGSRRDTHEISASLWFPRVYLAPRFSAWFDIDKVGGGYFEGTLAVPVLGNINAAPFWALYLTGELGYSFGQTFDQDKPDNPFYYADGRITHLDLGVGSDLPIGSSWFSSSASLHARVAVDDAATRYGLKSNSVDRWLAVYARVSLSAPRWKAGK
jgi:hypothetical protein